MDLTTVLPAELLRNIFIHTLPPPEDEWDIYEATEIAATLAAVCNRWRAVAMLTQALWATITIPVNASDTLDMLKKWINRSGNQALDLRITLDRDTLADCADVNDMLQDILPNISRVRSFEIDTHECHLYIKRLLHYQVQWSQLTSITLTTVPLDPKVALDFLRHAPRIVNASLALISTGQHSGMKSFICPHLQKLSLHISGRRHKILSVITLPSLEELIWIENHVEPVWWLWSELHALVGRSMCKIKLLDITYNNVTEYTKLFETLQLCPTLQTLRATYGASAALNAVMSNLVVDHTSSAIVLPMLEFLTLIFPRHVHINSYDLYRMVASRWFGSDQWKCETKLPLVSIDLEFHEPLPDFSHGPLAHLLGMKREGLRFTITNMDGELV